MRELAQRYERLGGTIHYGARVVDLLMEHDRAIGVRLEDGTEIRGDIVVWAADGHHLIFEILGGRYLNDEIRTMYSEWTPVKPLVHLMLGVARDLSGDPARITRELPQPIEIAGETHRWASIVNRSFDPEVAPRGKSVLEVWFATRFDYWKELSTNQKAYRTEKQRIVDRSLEALEERWPGISGQIEVADLATPMTYQRYTGNWQGSPDGWYPTIETFSHRSILRSLPGLAGLYTVGQWTAPFTGTVMAALSGRQLVELLCAEGHIRFLTHAHAERAAA